MRFSYSKLWIVSSSSSGDIIVSYIIVVGKQRGTGRDMVVNLLEPSILVFSLLVRLLLTRLIANGPGLSITPDNRGSKYSAIILGGEVVLVRYILSVLD